MQNGLYEYPHFLYGKKGVSVDINQYYRILRIYVHAADKEERWHLIRNVFDRLENDYFNNV